MIGRPPGTTRTEPRFPCTPLFRSDFVFESQIMISAARRLGTRCVSVPIESRYKSVHSREQFRPSHFRPLRDLWRITSHIVCQAVAYGERKSTRLNSSH